jgi:hypothetical protein
MTATWTDPTPVEELPAPTIDPIGLVLADALRELIFTGATTSERSLQQAVGMSEIGADCERQLAYKIASTPPVNLDPDPMPSIMGTGFHLHVQRMVERLDRRRYLVETPVTFKGIPGTVDLYDRRRRVVIDWKSTGKSKLRRLRTDGPPMRAQIQIQIYGAALRELGEDPSRLALAYVPRDGSLDDLWVWSTVPDQALVDKWVGRFESIVDGHAAGASPADFKATPGPLCKYCPHFLPTSTDLGRGCPGPNA